MREARRHLFLSTKLLVLVYDIPVLLSVVASVNEDLQRLIISRTQAAGYMTGYKLQAAGYMKGKDAGL